jgi:hypothetical protein
MSAARNDTMMRRSSTRRARSVWGAVAVAALGIGGACTQRQQPVASAREQVHPTYDPKTGALTRIEADSDHDGKIDTWAYMDGTRVVRVEVDENGDGIVDRWEYHSYSAQAGQPAPTGRAGKIESPDKTIERIERATRHDGVVSRWEYFTAGSLTRVEEDTDGDGRVDKWETYSDGTLTMMAIDTQHRGKPDRRLVYRPDGTLDRIEGDPTGSGNFQPLSPAAGK